MESSPSSSPPPGDATAVFPSALVVDLEHDAAKSATPRDDAQRFAGLRQSLELLEQAGAAVAGRRGAIEGVRGRIASDTSAEMSTGATSALLLTLLPEMLMGQEWGDAITAIVSLDIDVRTAARGATPLGPQAGPPTPAVIPATHRRRARAQRVCILPSGIVTGSVRRFTEPKKAAPTGGEDASRELIGARDSPEGKTRRYGPRVSRRIAHRARVCFTGRRRTPCRV